MQRNCSTHAAFVYRRNILLRYYIILLELLLQIEQIRVHKILKSDRKKCY